MAETNDDSGNTNNVGLTAEAITGVVNKALEAWQKNQKPADGGDNKPKAPTTEDITKIVAESVSGLLPDLTKNITENATKTAAETFKSQHYGEIENLTKQVQTLTQAKADAEKAAQEAQKKKDQENFNSLKPDEQLAETLRKQNEMFNNQITQVTQAIGSITERLNKNDLSSYRNTIIKTPDGKVRDDIIPELVQGNTIDELNESFKTAQAVKAQQTSAFAQTLGVKPEQLQDVIANIRKATGADQGASPSDQKISVPQNAGQNIDNSSAAGNGNIQVPTDMKDYKQKRKELLTEAAKSSTEMTG